uniref:Aminotransferase class I/II-fold pyridoxal phosphate-dependent enzyme n=1 Tax=candidate division WOR-3 bacterium TaxID=2052148 RepID=A0A7C2NZN3_UNCW3
MDIFKKCYEFEEAEKAKQLGYYPYFHPVASAEDTEVVVDGRTLVMLGSNNYLGLTTHPYVKKKAQEAIEKYGTGSCGSRFLNGTLDIHEELEEELAKFVGKEKALVFSTGYQTNLGIMSALLGKHDVVVLDKWDHASIVDGTRLGNAHVLRFKHNDMEHLERILKAIPEDRGILIVVDGVFSMEGDIANLPELVKLKEKYGARLMVDDAHSVGVLGKTGAGTAEHFGLTEKVDLIMSTFSKSFASIGGFVAGEAKVIEYIKHFARPMIFSAALAPGQVAAARAALEIIKTDHERRENLWRNTRFWQDGLRSLGFDIGETQTPIVPIIIGDDMKTFMFWKQLMEYGVYTNPVITPAVPPGRQLIRTSIMATHTREQLERALEAFKKAGKKLGIIS